VVLIELLKQRWRNPHDGRTMADDLRMALQDLWRKSELENADFLGGGCGCWPRR